MCYVLLGASHISQEAAFWSARRATFPPCPTVLADLRGDQTASSAWHDMELVAGCSWSELPL